MTLLSEARLPDFCSRYPRVRDLSFRLMLSQESDTCAAFGSAPLLLADPDLFKTGF